MAVMQIKILPEIMLKLTFKHSFKLESFLFNVMIQLQEVMASLPH